MTNNNLRDAQKSFQTLSKLLREIDKLDKKRVENLDVLKARIFEVETLLCNLEEVDALQAILGQLRKYAEEVDKSHNIEPAQYGIELAQRLNEMGFHLSGQYPELKAGIFHFEVDFQRGSTTIWYGPKQEKIAQCGLDPSTVSNTVEDAQKNLGSQLSAEEFRDKLKESYLLSASDGKPAEIIRVLSLFTWIYQDKKYHQDPSVEHYTEYSRMDFSYDLLRLRENLLDHVRLTVGTRMETADRSQYLWIPDDPKSGKGSRYSHLHFRS